MELAWANNNQARKDIKTTGSSCEEGCLTPAYE